MCRNTWNVFVRHLRGVPTAVSFLVGFSGQTRGAIRGALMFKDVPNDLAVPSVVRNANSRTTYFSGDFATLAVFEMCCWRDSNPRLSRRNVPPSPYWAMYYRG